MPDYSTVSGVLPLDELPVVKTSSGAQYSFVRFRIEVLTSGEVALALNVQNGIQAWEEEKEVAFNDGKLVVSFSKGTHVITLAIDCGTREQRQLSANKIDN